MFAIEIEFLTGRVYATDFRERDVPEWPPHPSRLFYALVAAFYESGLENDLRNALIWLEQQKPPEIFAGDHAVRLESVEGRRFTDATAPRVFVPINDDYSSKFASSSLRRKERRFPSAWLASDRVHFIWQEAEPDASTLRALRRIASQVSYLGHSASVVRVAIIESPRDATLKPTPRGDTLLRVPTPGRLEYLDREFARSSIRQFRPDTGHVQRYGPIERREGAEASAPTPTKSFGEMIVFEREGGVPDRSESLLSVTSALRASLLDRSPVQPAPASISGHGDTSHIAYIALPFVNHRRADGSLKGFAIVLPRGLSETDQLIIFGALNGFTELRGKGGVKWQIRRCVDEVALATLSEYTWTKEARVWASVSPVLLDRFPKPLKTGESTSANAPEYKPGDSPEEIIADACERVALPRPQAVRLHKNSLVLGVPPSTRFRLRRRKNEAPRPASHAIIEFPYAVRGPVLLGAGRYFGLGLFLPLPALQTIPL